MSAEARNVAEELFELQGTHEATPDVKAEGISEATTDAKAEGIPEATLAALSVGCTQYAAG